MNSTVTAEYQAAIPNVTSESDYADTRKKPFDTVRGVFRAGRVLYPNAGFREKNQIRICIRNLNCIKGYFHPPKPLVAYSIP